MKEIVEGFKKFFKFFCYWAAVYWFLGFVQVLPEPLAKRAMDKALSYLPFQEANEISLFSYIAFIRV